ncbi:MAG: hypothetical protein ACI9MR_004325, partial [Myxococcota bacterium]
REVRACFDCPYALGYLDGHVAAKADRLDKVIATPLKPRDELKRVST